MSSQPPERDSSPDPSQDSPTEHAEPQFIGRSSRSRTTAPGTIIDGYQLRELIGKGGMGEVWLADQTQPMRRQVAVKLVKIGMDTREVVARFESERQALALMDHPAIAKVFDAGATPQGRPYFVMEYVPGASIIEYCDKHKMTLRGRLELLIKVCDGVQHAQFSNAIAKGGFIAIPGIGQHHAHGHARGERLMHLRQRDFRLGREAHLVGHSGFLAAHWVSRPVLG